MLQRLLRALQELREGLDRLAALAGMPAVHVATVLASYERRWLMEQKVPFAVPRNQLHLPFLGIDVRPPRMRGSWDTRP